MSVYERLKASCLKKKELYEDPDFQAVQPSIFYHQTPPFQFVWKRPKVNHNLKKKSNSIKVNKLIPNNLI